MTIYFLDSLNQKLTKMFGTFVWNVHIEHLISITNVGTFEDK